MRGSWNGPQTLGCHPDSRGARGPEECTMLLWGMGTASCRSQLFIPVAKPRNPATGRMVRTSSAGNGGQSSSHTNPRVQTGNTHLHTHTPWDGVHVCL